MSHVVHRIRYGWSPSTLLGTRGMGPVESTLPGPELADWDRFLRDHVWAVGSEPAFTCVVNADAGALVRKVTTTNDGRPGSAADVLLSSALTPQRALGLAAWDGWHTTDMAVLSWAALEEGAHDGLAAVRTRARALRPTVLAGLFCELLRAPRDSYTVVGQTDPLAVTCALGDLIGRTPTFATDEADDAGPRLPTAVFLREVVTSATAATRRRLTSGADTRQVDTEPTVAGFAAAAVDAYTADGVDGIVRVRRPEPPADHAEARAWAEAMQLAPGVLADIRRLPRLPDSTLAGLAQPDTLDRVRAAAEAASSRDLGDALDRRLPGPVASVLVREAVARVFAEPTDDSLLYRLASVGPLPLDMLTGHLSGDLDHGTFVAQALLAPADLRALLEQLAATAPYADLIRWIEARSADDRASAVVAFGALCGRSGKASKADVEALVTHSALVDTARRLCDAEWQAADRVARLLEALPRRALGRDVVAALVARADPVLMHALDTVVTGKAGRAVIDAGIRSAYYRSHQLHEPMTSNQWK